MTLEGVIPLLPVVRERDCDPLSNGGLAPPPPPSRPLPVLRLSMLSVRKGLDGERDLSLSQYH
jgi:hypothetical protein